MPRFMPIRPVSIGPASRPGGRWKTPASGLPQILDADLAPPRRDRLIFTSGGTEANNLAILGIARAAATLTASPAERGRG